MGISREQLRAERQIQKRLLEDNLVLWRRLRAGCELARLQLEQHPKLCDCRLCAAARIALARPPAHVQMKLELERGAG